MTGAGWVPAISIAVLLTIWFALTVVANVTWLAERLLAGTILGRWGGLVPGWSFFAPNPTSADYTLLYRDRLTGGGVSGWTEATALGNRYRPWRSMLWQPEHRPKKALSDAVSRILHLVREGGIPSANLVLTSPYLLLLNYVSALPRSLQADGRQFIVLQHCADDRREVVVVLSSFMHDLEAAA